MPFLKFQNNRCYCQCYSRITVAITVTYTWKIFTFHFNIYEVLQVTHVYWLLYDDLQYRRNVNNSEKNKIITFWFLEILDQPSWQILIAVDFRKYGALVHKIGHSKSTMVINYFQVLTLLCCTCYYDFSEI